MTNGYRKGCLELPFQHSVIRFNTQIMVFPRQSQNKTVLLLCRRFYRQATNPGWPLPSRPLMVERFTQLQTLHIISFLHQRWKYASCHSNWLQTAAQYHSAFQRSSRFELSALNNANEIISSPRENLITTMTSFYHLLIKLLLNK